MAPRVLITHKLADEAVDVARQSCEVHFTPLDQPVDAPHPAPGCRRHGRA